MKSLKTSENSRMETVRLTKINALVPTTPWSTSIIAP